MNDELTPRKEQALQYLEMPLDDLAGHFAQAVKIYETRDDPVWVSNLSAANALLLWWFHDGWLIVNQWLLIHNDQIYTAICVKYDYCKKRQDAIWADKIEMLLILADVIAKIGLPELGLRTVAGDAPLLLAAILIRLELDRFCGCGGKFRCAGYTTKGRPCKHIVSKRGEYCWQHEGA